MNPRCVRDTNGLNKNDMKFSASALSLLASLSVAGAALAATEPELSTVPAPGETASIDWAETESSYVFESALVHGGVSFGEQYSFQSRFEYDHRFLIKD